MIEGVTVPGYLLSNTLMLSYASNALPSFHLPVILTCTDSPACMVFTTFELVLSANMSPFHAQQL